MKQKTIGLWMYRNDGGDIVQEKLKKLLEEKNIKVINDFDMRECYCFNGRVYTKEGFDLSSVDVFYHMNADEQTPFQNDILRALELSGVKVINDWDSFSTARNKFMTNVLLKKHGMNVPPALFVNSKQAIELAPRIFKEWKKICVKPTNKEGGKGIIAFDNEEHFVDYLEGSNFFTNSYYIEKLINFGTHDYRIEIFKGKIICGYSRKKTHSFKTNIAAGGFFISKSPPQIFGKIALKASKILNISTTIIDMVKSKDDNKIYIIEINPMMGMFIGAVKNNLLKNYNSALHYKQVVNQNLNIFFDHDEIKINLLVDFLTKS
jgi:ribosomal protein S6--L-glutamate ligase